MARPTLLFRAFALTTLLAALLLPGCGPPYRVIRQAAPNPMVHAPLFWLLPVGWEGVRVGRGTEEEYLAEGGRRASRYLESKRLLSSSLLHAAMHTGPAIEVEEAGVAPPRTGLLVRAHVLEFEPGFSVLGVRHDTTARVRMVIMSLEGQLFDEFEVRGASAIQWENRLDVRVDDLGKTLGSAVAQYLVDRTQPAQ